MFGSIAAALLMCAQRKADRLARKRARLRDEIHGFEALVILPNSAKASWELTGFPLR